jgi:hypothetical protein
METQMIEKGRHLFHYLPVQVGIPDDAVFLHRRPSNLKLRLDEGKHRRIRLDQPQNGRNNQFQGDEGRVHDGQVYRIVKTPTVKGADIGPLDASHTRVLAQTPGELPVTDIDGVDLRRPFLKEAIGKSARGRSHIEADKIPDADAERLHGALEFHPSAADIGMILTLDPDHGIDGNQRAGLIPSFFAHQDVPGQDQGPGPLSAGGQFTVHKEFIQPDLCVFQGCSSPPG